MQSNVGYMVDNEQGNEVYLPVVVGNILPEKEVDYISHLQCQFSISMIECIWGATIGAIKC